MCLGITAVALGMVMAGTGELKSLRLFRELRLCDKGVTYGEYTLYDSELPVLPDRHTHGTPYVNWTSISWRRTSITLSLT